MSYSGIYVASRTKPLTTQRSYHETYDLPLAVYVGRNRMDRIRHRGIRTNGAPQLPAGVLEQIDGMESKFQGETRDNQWATTHGGMVTTKVAATNLIITTLECRAHMCKITGMHPGIKP